MKGNYKTRLETNQIANGQTTDNQKSQLLGVF
jgi:hypothetical protein